MSAFDGAYGLAGVGLGGCPRSRRGSVTLLQTSEVWLGRDSTARRAISLAPTPQRGVSPASSQLDIHQLRCALFSQQHNSYNKGEPDGPDGDAAVLAPSSSDLDQINSSTILKRYYASAISPPARVPDAGKDVSDGAVDSMANVAAAAESVLLLEADSQRRLAALLRRRHPSDGTKAICQRSRSCQRSASSVSATTAVKQSLLVNEVISGYRRDIQQQPRRCLSPMLEPESPKKGFLQLQHERQQQQKLPQLLDSWNHFRSERKRHNSELCTDTRW